MLTQSHGTAVLERPGAGLVYEVTGDGPAVVLVHGFGLDMRMWDPQAEHLAARFRVVRYDCRGFGASGPFDPAVPYTHAGDLVALLDHLGIGEAGPGRPVVRRAGGAADRAGRPGPGPGPGPAGRGARRRALGPRIGARPGRGGPAGPGGRGAGRPGGLAGPPAVRRRAPAAGPGRRAGGHGRRATPASTGWATTRTGRSRRGPSTCWRAGRADPGRRRRTGRAWLPGDVRRAGPPHPRRRATASSRARATWSTWSSRRRSTSC